MVQVKKQVKDILQSYQGEEETIKQHMVMEFHVFREKFSAEAVPDSTGLAHSRRDALVDAARTRRNRGKFGNVKSTKKKIVWQSVQRSRQP